MARAYLMEEEEDVVVEEAIVWLSWDIKGVQSCNPCRTSLTEWINSQIKLTNYDKPPKMGSFRAFIIEYEDDEDVLGKLEEEIRKALVKCSRCNV